MNDRLTHFFNGARERLNDGTPAKRPSNAAMPASLKDIAQAEFGAILDALNATDNFTSYTEDTQRGGDTPAVKVFIMSDEELPAKLKDQAPGTHGNRPQADVSIHLEMPRPGHVSIQLLNFAVFEERADKNRGGVIRSFRVDEPASFEEARQLLGDALAEMAPVSMTQLCGRTNDQPRISIMRPVQLKSGR
jgi:hypothetical protein